MKRLIVGFAMLVLAPTVEADDFLLSGHEHLDVTESYDTGVMYDFSTADLLGGGINDAFLYDRSTLSVLDGYAALTQAYNNSTANILSGGSYFFSRLHAFDNVTVNMSGGQMNEVYAYNSSTVTLSGTSMWSVFDLLADDVSKVNVFGGGLVNNFATFNSATVNVSGSDIYTLSINGTSIMNQSGGNIRNDLTIRDASIVNVYGGTIESLHAEGTSTTNIHGYDFQAFRGGTLVDNKFIGEGLLTGKWYDGTSWVITVRTHSDDATINVITEPPKVTSVDVNGGDVTRSMVNSLVVAFDQIVTIDAGAFEVIHRGTGSAVDVSFTTDDVDGKTMATLTFSGALTDYGSLADGNYELTVRGDLVRHRFNGLALDGDEDGAAGGDHVFGDEEADALFRLFGDLDGSRFVGNNDYASFRLAFRKAIDEDGYEPQFDSDQSGFIGNNDYALFRLHFRTNLPFE